MLMNLTLTVDITKVMNVVKNHPCLKKKTSDKIANCLLDSVLKLVESQYLKRGYTKIGKERSQEKTTYQYSRGDDWLTIIQLFVKEPLIASLTIRVKKEELIYAEAILKVASIPQRCITLPS